MIATLTASEAIGAHPVAIISLGASSYGATRANLDLLRIYRVLLVSRGGDLHAPGFRDFLWEEKKDVGADFEHCLPREACWSEFGRVKSRWCMIPSYRENVASAHGDLSRSR